MDQSKYIPPVAKQVAGEHTGTASGRKPWKVEQTSRERRRSSKHSSKKNDWISINKQN